MTRFVYLHGFNSAYDPTAEKVQMLQRLGTVSGVTYDTYDTYENILDFLTRQIVYSDDLVLVGTSLGGFWAAVLAKHLKVPSVIINPCHNPYELLQKYVNVINTNYYTSITDVLSFETVETYEEHQLVTDTETFHYTPVVLLDMADEVINSYETQSILSGFRTVVFEGGSHRFDHMQEALLPIQEYINACSIVDHANRY